LTCFSSRSVWSPHNRRRERSLKTLTLVRTFAFALLALALAMPQQAAADDSSTLAAYQLAVQHALDAAQGAAPNDSAKARDVVAALREYTGIDQPEIIADLQRNPPEFQDAISRLQALRDALNAQAQTSDPVLAQQRLHGVMSMPRYDALHRQPSWLDQLKQWVGDRINELLQLFFGGQGSGAQLRDIFFYVIGTIAVAAVAFIVFRSARGRFAEGVIAGRPAGPRRPADYFAEADRLAAAGDRVGAIRALCAGVAATLAGERTWEGSPLTVREIFRHSADPASLHPLLIPFEAAVYGGRDVDEATYERAVQVAAIYRRPAEQAA
jgi:hypothetical protein